MKVTHGDQHNGDGNRLAKTNNITAVSETYTYEPNSQRLASIDHGDGTATEFMWTANGEQKTKTDAEGTTTYTWGPDGTLLRVELPGGQVIEYEYDHRGERIGRKVFASASTVEPTEYERYLVDRENLTGYSQVVAVIDGGNGTVKTLNTFTDQIAAQTDFSGNTADSSQLFTDGLGSVRALTTETSNEAYDYAAFGSLLSGNRSLTPFAFTGQIADAATGLQYHRARWLDVFLGSWASPDPEFDFPENFGHPYLYAMADPNNHIDLLGTFTIGEATIVNSTINLIVEMQSLVAEIAADVAFAVVQNFNRRQALLQLMATLTFSIAAATLVPFIAAIVLGLIVYISQIIFKAVFWAASAAFAAIGSAAGSAVRVFRLMKGWARRAANEKRQTEAWIRLIHLQAAHTQQLRDKGIFNRSSHFLKGSSKNKLPRAEKL